MAKVDLVIRRGNICDGLGGKPVEGDVAIADGKIVEVGKVSAQGREEIDAQGHIVSPGWVDIHTHYDGQATWDPHIQPSSNQGVTTIVMGNCGVGFAPVRTGDHNTLIELMEGVEDIPGAALHEGLKWNWESFPQYLDALESIQHDVDIGTQLPHGALRVYVMGERGRKREPTTEKDRHEMARIVKEALQAGALGFSSSRTIAHRSTSRELIPSYGAAHEELAAIAQAMADVDKGVMQYTTDNAEDEQEWKLLSSVTRISRRPMSLSVAQAVSAPNAWRVVLDLMEKARREGLHISGQVPARAIGLMLGLQGSVHPFVTRPSYAAIADLSLEERVRAMRDPNLRARILSEKNVAGTNFQDGAADAYDRIFYLGDPPNYEPHPDTSIGAEARAKGVDPAELVYDLLIADDGKGFLYRPRTNYADGSLDVAHTLLASPYTVPGLSDGGAHVGVVCDASMPTFLLTHWARDRVRGEKFDIGYLIRRQTHDTAAVHGLLDRGVLRPGYRADINIIDHDNLRLKVPEMRYDLPTGAKRLYQEAEGYVATIVAGQATYRDGQTTGALPGRLIRGSRGAPN